MDNGSAKLRRTNEDIEVDNGPDATPRQRDNQVDTDTEFNSNVGSYKTPVALQKKKKTVPVIVSSSTDSEGESEDFQSEIEKMIEKKKSKGQRPVPDNATQTAVRQDL
jgi:hypothetical protein